MPVAVTSSQFIYQALKSCNIRLLSALPETWLVHLIRLGGMPHPAGALPAPNLLHIIFDTESRLSV